MRIELVYFAGCPNAAPARQLLARCLEHLGLPNNVEEVELDYPSPSIRVNGNDVMGEPSARARACRLDVPTEARLMVALRAGIDGAHR